MSILQRKDRHGEWWVDLRANGRRYRRKASIQTLEGAIEHEARLREEFTRADSSRDSFPLHARSTYAEFAEHWMADHVAIANRPSTVLEKECGLKSRLLPKFGHLPLEEVSTNTIDAAAASWIRSGMSVKRANNLLSILRQSLRCAVEWGILPRAPLVRHHRYFPPVPQYLTRAESRRLLESMESGFWRTFVGFLLGTGVRFGEAAALRWDDLDLDGPVPTVVIRRGVVHGIVAEPKTKASRRTIILIPEVVVALRLTHRSRRHTGHLVAQLWEAVVHAHDAYATLLAR